MMCAALALGLQRGGTRVPKLILVRHSNSDHNPHQPAADWALTAEGIRRCRPLAQHIRGYQPKRLYTSAMPKARQTAEVVARALGAILVHTCPALAEHSRDIQRALRLAG